MYFELCNSPLRPKVQSTNSQPKSQELSVVHLHLIRLIHSFLRRPDREHPPAAWESRCGSAVFQQSFEHSFRPARHRQFVGKDYHRSGSCIHANSTDAFVANAYRIQISVAINVGADFNSDSGARSTGSSCKLNCARGLTFGQQVGK